MVCAGTYTENVRPHQEPSAARRPGDRGRLWAHRQRVNPYAANPNEWDTGVPDGAQQGSIINGFTFVGGTGLGSIRSTSGPINDIQLLNNRIRGFTGNGVFLNDNGINITVNQNEIDGTNKVGGGGLFHLDTDNFDGFRFTNNCVGERDHGTGFFVDGKPQRGREHGGRADTTLQREFHRKQRHGVNLGSRAWGDGPITGNTFSNNLLDGLQGGPKGSPTTPLPISQNTFDSEWS